ncbi:hypothetical protein L2E82_42371 [Cichorium intybus]|uniref:Uncharacterized protein n=1 Tax=Cichorium intybus TaxID=13427 RepID=A0ACB8ZN30_CICIN|nr:hypothetical protein L2E82_42371 [Cichorium intybus]
MTRTSATLDPNTDEVVDSELVPSSLVSIVPILRVANEIEKDNARVAYLCRYYAFWKAQKIDPKSSGRGALQFKTYLLHRLEREEVVTKWRLARSDNIEIQLYYRMFYEKNISEGQYTKTPEEMAKIYQIATVLYDAVKIMIPGSKIKPEIQRYARDVEEKKEQYGQYNILPFYGVGNNPAITKLPEIQAALRAIRNMDNLPSVRRVGDREKPVNDILEWLSSIFGFQKGNVRNQQEHLVLLLANIDRRSRGVEDYDQLDSHTVKHLLDKTFENYVSWCDYLRCTSIIDSHKVPPSIDRQQLHLLYIGLYLLIWGEAANIRFMPECLCYIFHNMANEMHRTLFRSVQAAVRGGTYQAAPLGEEAFLRDVITPIYEVVRKEARRNQGGQASHASWRNYDDLNEYFWSDKCFKLGWPMNRKSGFFVRLRDSYGGNQFVIRKKKPKTNFVEVRTFLHLYRSFDRMWIFLILVLQAMIIVAWHEDGSIFGILDEGVIKNISSIFITYAFLNFIRATLDIILITLLMWWAQPKLYVGRGMHEDIFSLFKYTLFWIVLLISKFAFSYYVEILPLVYPTKLIMKMHVSSYEWHEFFPNVTHNIGVVISIWAPIVMVYFMDTQIWYAIYATIIGGIYGAFNHLGEIRTLGMLRSRFKSVPLAFCKRLVPMQKEEPKRGPLEDDLLARKNIAKFSQVWNEFIFSMRMQDLISNRERDLLLVPYTTSDVPVVQWPPFLLASKIPIALDMAIRGKQDAELFRKISSDEYMRSAVIECYQTLKELLFGLLENEQDIIILQLIFHEIETSIQQRTFLSKFCMIALPSLNHKLEIFLDHLQADNVDAELYAAQIINILQDIMEIITKDVMTNGNEILERADAHYQDNDRLERFERINFQLTQTRYWQEKVVRLRLLLTVKESAINVPTNLEARRRITFFANSLYMKMPNAPIVHNMFSFSVLTPYYKEDVLYTDEALHRENEDGITILFYLQKIYPDEWKNFEERIRGSHNKPEATSQWVSYRGQTLFRTVRGIMYYKKALELQCFLDYAKDDEIFAGFQTVNMTKHHMDLKERARAMADLKFTYVVSCQVYGAQKKSSDERDQKSYINILNLMLTYPSLRVAYIDEREATINGISQKVYYSVLVKGGDCIDEEIYRIKLPGPPTVIGEGKAENQNHAIIFTRGEALQTIDMNQDNYFEEAFKMRNVLEEFHKHHHGQRAPTILGLREHIFTGSVSSLAWFMSNQETSFVTIGQRVLADPLRVRFHYGHPDIFDRLFHITRGGVSKASRSINSSEGIFSGYNSTLRGGYVTHHEYIQVGKARDVGMNQISLFEGKVAYGNGEQTLSRDVYRLGSRFDFYRMLSFYFTTVGFYFSSMVTVLIYGLVYHLHIARGSTSRLVYGLSWVVMLSALLALKFVSMSRQRFGTKLQLPLRILKALLFLGFFSIMIVLSVKYGLTIGDIFASFLAFLPTGWAFILIGQACRCCVKCIGFWDSIMELGRAYEYVMGFVIFIPIAILSWVPFVSEFQTRLLFNQAFSRGLQISMILAGKKGMD